MDFFLNFLRLLCEVLTITIFLRAIMSWISLDMNNSVARVLFQITEPLLAPLRRIIPRAGMFDLTPLVAIILLQVISRFLL